MSAGHVGGTRGLCIVSNAADVLWMSVVRGMRGVGVARGGVDGEGGEFMKGLALGFTNPVGTGGVLDVCLCLACSGVDGLGGEWVGGRGLGPGSGGVG